MKWKVKDLYKKSFLREGFLKFGIEPAALSVVVRAYYKTRQKCVGGVCGEFYQLAEASWADGWERPVLEDILSTVRPEDTMFDIGSEYGVYSILMSLS